MSPAPRRAVFLDRDDTILVDESYMSDAGRITLVPGAREALASLQDAGLPLVLISNQSGVARGLVTEAQVRAIQNRMCALLGVSFAAFEYCFHHPAAGCDCRKPRPTMIHRAATRLGIDLCASAMVGDKEIDVVAGNAAGCWSILVSREHRPRSTADLVVPDLGAAARAILDLGRKGGGASGG